MYNLLRLFSISGIDMCPGGTTWQSMREPIPERNEFSLPLLSLMTYSSSLGVGPCVISPTYIDMSNVVFFR